MKYEPSEIEMEYVDGGYRANIIGSGGGKKSSGGGKGSKGSKVKQPTEADVSLRSKAFVTIVAVLGEGEIEGFATPVDLFQDIYLDDTPIRNPDGTINLQEVTVDFRHGNQIQSHMPLGDGIESEQSVNIKVSKSAGPVVRNVNQATANLLKVRLMTPMLREVDKDNNLIGTSIRFRIDLSTQGGPFATAVEHSIEGYTTGPYERTYIMELATAGPWTVRVVRLTDDSTTTKLTNDLYFQAFTTVIQQKYRYPNTALMLLRLSAEQFQSIPRLSVHLRQLRVRVPHNYDPVNRTYTGMFNGGLKYAYTNNPAWCMYDLLTNGRYGIGELIDVNAIDLFSIYSIGQNCDERVPTGVGTNTEPRFSCNVFIQSQDDAYKVLDAFASIFRGMVYYAAGTIFVAQDRVRDPVRIYTDANVIQEVDDQGRITAPPFTYTGAGKSAIHTVAMVSYSDPLNLYKTEIEYVEDQVGRERYGYNPTEVTAFACTSRSQARRVGTWLLTSERIRSEVIVFKVGTEGLLVRPNEVFRVQDSARAGIRWGGRIVAATSTSITIDNPITPDPSVMTMLLVLDGNGELVNRPCNTTPGQPTNVLPFTTPIIPPPQVNGIWVTESTSILTQLFQCLKVVEVEPHIYEITGTAYDPTIYNFVDLNTPLERRSITGLRDPRQAPGAPGAPEITETLYATIESAGVKSRLDISWAASGDVFTAKYILEWKLRHDFSYITLAETIEPRYVMYDVAPGVYDFRVRAVNSLGVASSTVEARFEVRGLTEPPADVNELTVVALGETALLSWEVHPDVDVRIGGTFKVKHANIKSGANWVDGLDLAIVPGSATTLTTGLMDGTYMIKAVDSSGNQSVNADYVVIEGMTSFVQTNVMATTQQSPTFPGARINVVSTGSSLKLASTDMFDYKAGLWDASPGNIDQAGNYFDSISGLFDAITGMFEGQGSAYGLVSPGYYYFQEPFDLGAIYSVRAYAEIEAFEINEQDLFDNWAGTFDQTIGLFQGSDIDSAYVILEIATSNNGTHYSAYKPWKFGDYTGRFFRFRLYMNAGVSNHNIQVNKLIVHLDMPDRIESGWVVTATTPVGLSYNPPFRDTPFLATTLLDSQSGDYLQMSGVSNQGFTILAKNSANANVARNVVWFAKGYGMLQPNLDTAEFSPKTLTNLAIWYEQEMLLDNNGSPTVSRWTDLSGNNRHSTQTTKNIQPFFAPDTFNGFSALRFDGNRYLRHTYIGEPRTLIIVGNSTSGGTHQAFTGVDSTRTWNDSFYFVKASTGLRQAEFCVTNVEQTNLVSAIIPEKVGSPQIYICQYDGATYSIWDGNVKNTKNFTGTRSTPSATPAAAIGGNVFNDAVTDRLIGNMYEFILYDRVLPPEEVDTILDYLINKYGF
jgi:predicted phage tail protein